MHSKHGASYSGSLLQKCALRARMRAHMRVYVYVRTCTYAHRTTKSGHPILLSRIRPRRPADFDDRFEVAHALLTVGTRWSWTSVRSCTCENPFREGKGRCQTVFFVGRTKGSKKHVPRGKKNRKGSNTYIASKKGGEREKNWGKKYGQKR